MNPKRDLAVVIGIGKPKPFTRPPSFGKPKQEEEPEATEATEAPVTEKPEAPVMPMMNAGTQGSFASRIISEGESLGLDRDTSRYFARHILQSALDSLDEEEGGELPPAA